MFSQVLTKRKHKLFFTTGIHLSFKHIQIRQNFDNTVAVLFAPHKEKQSKRTFRQIL